MSLSNLPDITFVDADTETAKTEIIAAYEAISGESLAPGDPRRLFLESVAAENAQLRAYINFTGRMNLLAYATGDYLDHLGALVDTERIAAQAATTTVKFTLSGTREEAIVIPAGTRVTDANQTVYFAVDSALTIAAGETTGEIGATCTETGEDGNGYLAGQLNTIVDPVAYVASAVNTTESEGGAAIEDDDTYRERIHLAPESFSVAGPYGAYEYWAKSASPLIEDVAVLGPDEGLDAGCVEVYPLLEGGELPGEEILDAVDEVLNNLKIRPLTDKVNVKTPTPVSYELDAEYYIAEDDKASATAIQAAVTEAVANYILWQRSALGRDLDPTRLYRLMSEAGAVKVTVKSPAITAVNATSVAIPSSQSVTYKGVADD